MRSLGMHKLSRCSECETSIPEGMQATNCPSCGEPVEGEEEF